MNISKVMLTFVVSFQMCTITCADTPLKINISEKFSDLKAEFKDLVDSSLKTVKTNFESLQWSFWSVEKLGSYLGNKAVVSGAKVAGRTQLEIDSIPNFKVLYKEPIDVIDDLIGKLSTEELMELLSQACKFNSVDELITWQNETYPASLTKDDALKRLLQSAAFEENQKQKKLKKS